MGSTRLPGKVMKKINDHSVIEIIINRLAQSSLLNEIIVATSDDPRNDLLQNHIKELGYICERGSENDVLSRFYDIANKHSIDVIVRITGDCPFIDSSIVDRVISKFLDGNNEYVSNVNPPSYPDGLDVEVFSLPLWKKQISNLQTYLKESMLPHLSRTTVLKNTMSYTKMIYLIGDGL